MKQYLVTGYDYPDAEAFNRRMSIRPNHLDGVRTLKANGNYLIGGAMLNDEGKMIGSTMVLQFETEAGLEEWRVNEPYILNGIWETVEIKDFKVADV